MKIFYFRILSLLPHFIYKRLNLNTYFSNSSFKKIIENDYITKELFEGRSEEFRTFHNDCKIYAEYGCGLSTLYSTNIAKKRTISVDTDINWVQKIKDNLLESNIIDIHYIDIGPTGNWGMPQSYSKRNNFKNYLNIIWSNNDKPDFVLIDGRFRIASFLTSLKFAEKNTIICFDDYVNRKIYNIVEEFEQPFLLNERQAYFKVSKDYDLEKLNNLIDKFEYVLI